MEYTYNIPDEVPTEAVDKFQTRLNQEITRLNMEEYGKTKGVTVNVQASTSWLLGYRLVLEIPVAETAYAKRVLKRIYQNGLFDKHLCLEVVIGTITIITDGIGNLADLKLALDEPA